MTKKGHWKIIDKITIKYVMVFIKFVNLSLYLVLVVKSKNFKEVHYNQKDIEKGCTSLLNKEKGTQKVN